MPGLPPPCCGMGRGGMTVARITCNMRRENQCRSRQGQGEVRFTYGLLSLSLSLPPSLVLSLSFCVNVRAEKGKGEVKATWVPLSLPRSLSLSLFLCECRGGEGKEGSNSYMGTALRFYYLVNYILLYSQLHFTI